MKYEQFKRIETALSKYFENASNIGYDALRNKFAVLNARLTTDSENARKIAYLYRLYRKKEYSLKKLVYHVIITRYGDDEVYENAFGEKAVLKFMTQYEQVNKKVNALIKFMNCVDFTNTK